MSMSSRAGDRSPYSSANASHHVGGGPMLDLRRMMLLCDLADLGTVTAVAERRSITSSAVSQQLRVLEGEVGAVLFQRDGRKLGLTRAGQVFVDHLRRVVGAIDEAMSAVAATRDSAAGNLVIAAFNM